MPRYPWKEFLTEWSKEIISSKAFAEFLTYPRNIHPENFTPDVLASGWLGYPGATEEQIRAAESRLGVVLPPDYREFLQVSNGWKWFETLVPNIWSVEEIEWLRISDPETVEVWASSMELYGDEDPWPEVDYIASTLRISDREYAGTAYLLLNPEVVSASGEWELWYFAHWVPGAQIYSSFWEFVHAARSDLK